MQKIEGRAVSFVENGYDFKDELGKDVIGTSRKLVIAGNVTAADPVSRLYEVKFSERAWAKFQSLREQLEQFGTAVQVQVSAFGKMRGSGAYVEYSVIDLVVVTPAAGK